MAFLEGYLIGLASIVGIMTLLWLRSLALKNSRIAFVPWFPRKGMGKE